MSYKIEDIDWSKMPEGAVEFMLEDEEYFLTWVLSCGNRGVSNCNGFSAESDIAEEDNRTRYKVADYHPDMKNPAKQWRGPEDGFPPIGMKAVTSGGECVIIGVDDNKREVALQWVSNGELGVVGLQCVKPIKSDHEKWIESAYTLFPDIEDCPKEVHLLKLYDAFQSGTLPIPEAKK